MGSSEKVQSNTVSAFNDSYASLEIYEFID